LKSIFIQIFNNLKNLFYQILLSCHLLGLLWLVNTVFIIFFTRSLYFLWIWSNIMRIASLFQLCL
jgi:hypothetical protein